MTYNERLKKPPIWAAAPVLFRIVLLTTWGDPNMVKSLLDNAPNYLAEYVAGLCLIQSSTRTERADFFSHHFGTEPEEKQALVVLL